MITDINFNNSSFIATNCWGTTVVTSDDLITMLKPNTQYKILADVTLLSKPDDLSSASNHHRLLTMHNGSTNIIMLNTSTRTVKDNWQVNETKKLIGNFTTPSSLENFRMITYCYHLTTGAEGKFKYDNVMILENTETDENFEQHGVMPSSLYPSPIRNCGENGSIDLKAQNKNYASTKILEEKNLEAITDITENSFTVDLSKRSNICIK